MKKKGGKVTLDDIERARGSFSRDFIAKNPHLQGSPASAMPPSASFEPEKAAQEPPKGKKRGIRRSPQPKTRPEREMDLMLQRQLREHAFHSYRFEAITLIVGEGLRYTPDFTVWKNDGSLRFIEVKGPHMRRHGRQVFQAAVMAYPLAQFELWMLDAGNWTKLN